MCLLLHLKIASDLSGSLVVTTATAQMNCVDIAYTAFHENELNFTVCCMQSRVILHMRFYLWDCRCLENTYSSGSNPLSLCDLSCTPLWKHQENVGDTSKLNRITE